MGERFFLKPVVHAEDWVLDLANETRAFGFSTKEILLTEHKAYWKRKLKSKDFRAWGIWLGSVPIGIIRIENTKVGIAITKQFRSKQFGFKALSQLDLKNCFAEVKPGNKRSIALFKKLGFKEKKRVFEND